MMELVIPGQAPAQKNNKNIGYGKSGLFVTSNKIVKTWQKEALQYLNDNAERFRPDAFRIAIDYYFYVKDDRQRDTDNMITSVNDILQQALAEFETVIGRNGKPKKKIIKRTGLIAGDHWQYLRLGLSEVEIDEKNPRTVLHLYAEDDWKIKHSYL